MQHINFYRNKVAINVLAKDIANAREIYDAAEGHAVIGILSAQFSSVEEGAGGGRPGAVLQSGDDCLTGPSGTRQPDLYRLWFCGRRAGGNGR